MFAFTRPDVIALKDEVNYIRQANAFANGQVKVDRYDTFTGELHRVNPSEYPPGTSLVASLFILFGGWTSAFWMPAISLIAATCFTAFMLRSLSLHPAYSLIFLLYPPALVMGRIVSSDVISASVVAFGLWAFFSGSAKRSTSKNGNQTALLWFISGLIAGISLLFRETNALLFLPLFLGTIFRRNDEWTWLLVGGLIGLGFRLLASWIVFDSFFYVKEPYSFQFSVIWSNMLIYLPSLLLMVPGGLIFAFLYKGERRPEIIATILLFVLFYLTYSYSGRESGGLIQWVLGPRFFIPLLPLFALTAAESLPRVLNKLSLERFSNKQVSYSLVALLIAMILSSQFYMHQWLEPHRNIQGIINEQVPADSIVIMNNEATLTYISELQGYHTRVNFEYLSSEEANMLDEAYIVFLQRSGSGYWRNFAVRENNFLDSIQAVNILDEKLSSDYHLKIYIIGHETTSAF